MEATKRHYKITLEVSCDNECTESPWWMIIDPKQNMTLGNDGVNNIAHMITGPFFSREEAEIHLKNRRYAFGKNACVWCHSGYWSKQYKEAYKKAEHGESVNSYDSMQAQIKALREKLSNLIITSENAIKQVEGRIKNSLKMDYNFALKEAKTALERTK